MKNKTFANLASIIGAVITFLAILYNFADLPNKKPNGFKRFWPGIKLVPLKKNPTTAPLQKIVGLTGHNVFISVENPQFILMTDTDLVIRDTVDYGLKLNDKLLGANNTIVDSPLVYFFANNVPAMLKGRLHSSVLDTFLFNCNVFTRSEKTNTNFAILRTLDSSLNKQEFIKLDLESGQVIKSADVVIDQQKGGFESDGWLKFDPYTNCIYYVEFYRNRFYCLDTNLNTVYNSTTIDTVRTNEIVVKSTIIDGEKRLMPANSRIRVNKDCYITDGFLFNISGLKADNENYSDFRNNAVVDVYDLKDGSYDGSFYIPIPYKHKIKSFSIHENLVYVITGNQISVYSLSVSGKNFSFKNGS